LWRELAIEPDGRQLKNQGERMARIVVTGCNRGIGLELVRQLTERGDEVIGVCRKPSKELEATGAEILDGIDVSDPRATDQLQDGLGDRNVDILINNAGILRGDRLDDIDDDDMIEQYKVNTLGPLRVTRALLDKLAEGSKVAIVTSRVGSIADNSSGGNYGYRASKAAVNQVGMNLKIDLEPKGIAVALLHPGLVATDMTGGHGIEPAISAKGLIERIDQLDMSKSGSFWHAEGYELPW
jgi:NAD(P)-dependent dehydrogenase (short-subunit alcohol dehydrogenase family)